MLCLISAILLVVFIGLYSTSRTTKIFPMPYSQPSIFYYLKVLIFYGIVSLKKKSDSKNAGFGKASYNDVTLMEKPQKLPNSVKAIDAVFFSGANKDGWGVIMAMQRRPKRVSTNLSYVKTPEGNVLVPLSHPDCFSFRNEEDDMIHRADGLEITPVTPMKEWSIKFSGKLRNADSKDAKGCDVSVDLKFESDFRYFDYDTDMDQWTISKSFAREPWSRQFFENLKSNHQTHYEQMGHLNGSITIDGIKTELKMAAFRDHSYGSKRDWSLMHRYTFHHIFLDDGQKGVIGVVCQPTTCTRLVCGHWWTTSGKGSAVTDVNLYLHEHGEHGTSPTDYAYTFVAGDKQHTVQVTNDTTHNHYLGWDWEAKFYESFVKYDVDGIPGVGITEWHYNNKCGRPLSYTENDPEWSQPLRQEYLTT